MKRVICVVVATLTIAGCATPITRRLDNTNRQLALTNEQLAVISQQVAVLNERAEAM